MSLQSRFLNAPRVLMFIWATDGVGNYTIGAACHQVAALKV